MKLYESIKTNLKETELDNPVLQEIYDNLQAGISYGEDMDKEHHSWVTYPYFDEVLYLIANNGVGREVIGWKNYGSSANPNTIKDLNWIITEIFKMTPEEFTQKYIKSTDSKLMESENITLIEASTGSNKYVNAYMDLSYSMFDGMGDWSDWSDFADVLADDYGIKFNGHQEAEQVVAKGMAIMYEKDPERFKEYVESLIIDSCINNGYFDYLDSKSHKEKSIVKSLQTLLEYLQNNGGSPEAIDGITNELGELSNVQTNARQVGEEFCRYMEEHSFWKIMGTNCRYWTNKDLAGLPNEYACFTGSDFNFLLYDKKWTKDNKTENEYGLGYGFKNSDNGVIADLLTYKYPYIDFQQVGDSFEITPENKDGVFAKMNDTFVMTANQLKKKNLGSYESFLKGWRNEDTEENRKEYKENLRKMGIKESEIKNESQTQEIEAVLETLKEKNPNIEKYLNEYYKVIADTEPKPAYDKEKDRMNPAWENWNRTTNNVLYSREAWENFTNWVKEKYGENLNEADNMNTTTSFIDIKEIIKYAENYLMEKLNATASIVIRPDGQYTLTIPNTDKTVADYLKLHNDLHLWEADLGYKEKLGGDPEDFISDIQSIKNKLNELDADKFATKLAYEVWEQFDDTCDYQIRSTQDKFLNESYNYIGTDTGEAGRNDKSHMEHTFTVYDCFGEVETFKTKEEAEKYIEEHKDDEMYTEEYGCFNGPEFRIEEDDIEVMNKKIVVKDDLEESEEKVIKSLKDDKEGLRVDIVKAPNGKFFNYYYSGDEKHANSNAGPFNSADEAIKMAKKHRSSVKESEKTLAVDSWTFTE